MTRRRAPEEYEVFEKVLFVRSTAKAVLCRFKEDPVSGEPGERWVPTGQMPPGFYWDEGKIGDLEVTTWLVGRWHEEDPKESRQEPEFQAEDVCCLRETDKAIQVRVPGQEEPIWIPKGQLRPRSEVQNDGDLGLLVVTQWIAEQKGLIGGGAAARQQDLPRVADDVRAKRPRRDAPQLRQEEARDVFNTDFFPAPDPDDDIPF